MNHFKIVLLSVLRFETFGELVGYKNRTPISSPIAPSVVGFTCGEGGIVVLLVFWTIWFAWNACIFEGVTSSISELATKAGSLTYYVLQAFKTMEGHPSGSRLPREVSWLWAGEDTFVLNVDGNALQKNPGMVAFGGLVWDFEGPCLAFTAQWATPRTTQPTQK